MNNILSIGSVVKLKSKNRMPIAIIGYYPVSNEKKYDYCGVALPFGFIKNGGMYLFNAKEIDCILFESIQNLESELMKEIFFEL